MMKIRQIEFRRGSCRMALWVPMALEDMPMVNLRKFFKFMGTEFSNDESTREFFSCIPETEEYLRECWNYESKYFQEQYVDPDFTEKGYRIDDPKERKSRRAHNKRLENRLKEAKGRYDRFQKRIPKLKELQELYT